jgi:hypothetical protein
MKPRTIILLGVALIILACVGVYAYFMIANGGASSAVDGNVALSSGGNEVILPAAQAIPDAPTSTLLVLGTPHGSVQVNNFYLSNPLVTDGGETVILASTTDYMITYDTTDSSFWVGIESDRFAVVRPAAEQALLSTLGVSSTVACELDVSVGTFYSASSTMNGQSFSLSSCGNLNRRQ